MRRRPLIFAAAAGLLGPHGVRAQLLTEAHVKARMAFNLARFTQWPAQAFADAAAPHLWAAAVRGEMLARALAALAGETVAGRTIKLTLNPAGLPRGCHVLVVEGEVERAAAALLGEAAGEPVLTIGDGDGFSQRGIIGLVNSNDTIRFDINLTRMRAARLNIGSQVLKLARRVHE